ncbi:hypothetical protein B0681_04620 [Moraxella porci DSM 25326]|uniref:Uncharacterized protein n=1 Tax=Moraxella porci DSM 25326 TaxID=573983 RepID=A0A1T0CSJ1_9GAMM|nr:hypothetical protein B0681_04620 [Moraxella porci DSM 25326]
MLVLLFGISHVSTKIIRLKVLFWVAAAMSLAKSQRGWLWHLMVKQQACGCQLNNPPKSAKLC